MKTYGLLTQPKEEWGATSRQVRVIVRARSQARAVAALQAAGLTNQSVHHLRTYGGETGNPIELEVTDGRPEQVFWIEDMAARSVEDYHPVGPVHPTEVDAGHPVHPKEVDAPADAAQTSVTFSPVAVARDAGARGSSWHRLGTGPWYGTVELPNDCGELQVEETSSGWKVTDETTKSTTTGRDLPKLLSAAVKRSVR